MAAKKSKLQRTWNIGNTTVRNPKRIDDALRVFYREGFSGNVDGKKREALLHLKLKENGILWFEGETNKWNDLNGRKWRAAFSDLGLITDKNYFLSGDKYKAEDFLKTVKIPPLSKSYQITPAGIKLVNATTLYEIEDIFLRQLCCYEIPNAIENSFVTGKMKPFILFLDVLLKLQNKGAAGLTKFETGLFIQTFRDYNSSLSDSIVKEIIHFRDGLSKLKKAKEVTAYKNKYIRELQKNIEIKSNSVIKDYADTTFRYFSLSGLLTPIEDRITIRTNKINFVHELIKSEPSFLALQSPEKYFEIFYQNSFKLPTDQKEVALAEIKELEKVVSPKSKLHTDLKKISEKSTDYEIQKMRYQLKEYDEWKREQEYAENLKSDIVTGR